MLSLSHAQRIYLARGVCDMRKGANSLAALVREELDQDPLSGDAFVFVSKRRNTLKILMWDVSGFWLAWKRLEQGQCAVHNKLFDKGTHGSHVLSVAEMMSVIEGINIHHATYHQHYSLKK